jgi:carbon starvation protein
VPVGRLSRPQGYLAALLGALLLAIFFASALITSPPIAAPEFHRAADAPGAIPFLFVTLTSGALAGFYLLVANAVAAGQLEREADARFVGYGGALALGAAALSAVIAGSVAFRSTEEWQAFYASWVGLADVHRLLTLYVDTVARTTAGLGLDAVFLRHLGAVTVVGLLVAALDAGLRAQRRLLAAFAQRHALGRLGADRPVTLATLGLPALVALYLSQQPGAADWLRALGMLDQAAAAGGLLLIAAALKRSGLPAAAAAAAFLALLVLLAWALAAQMVEWLHHGHWLRAGLWLVLLLAVSALAAAAWRVLRQPGPS